jgi:hypothetical protein
VERVQWSSGGGVALCACADMGGGLASRRSSRQRQHRSRCAAASRVSRGENENERGGWSTGGRQRPRGVGSGDVGCLGFVLIGCFGLVYLWALIFKRVADIFAGKLYRPLAPRGWIFLPVSMHVDRIFCSYSCPSGRV